MAKCSICPNHCGVDREKIVGSCGAGSNMVVALASLHYDEEPCISGTKGSGTIFFSFCNMHCIFCQNYQISQQSIGQVVSVKQLVDMILMLQQQGAHNINLVSPTIYALPIKEAILQARNQGFNLPVIYNSNGYDSVETLKLLYGVIDIYLPDFKYASNDLAMKYSKVDHYEEYACNAIQEMYSQVGKPTFNEQGILQSGLIVRHLILPGNTINSLRVLDRLKEIVGNELYISLMAQYFPTYLAKQDDKLNRQLNRKELDRVKQYSYKLGFKNGYVQRIGRNEEVYVPHFFKQ